MMREKRDIRPVLFKFGVALAFTLGGILYNFLRTKRIRSSGSSPSPSLPSPERQSQAHYAQERVERKDDDADHALQKTPDSRQLVSTAPDKDASLFLSNCTSYNLASNFSSSKTPNGDKDTYLLPEFNDLVKEFDSVATRANFSPQKDVEMLDPNAAAVSCNERLEQEQEIKRLRDMVTTLTERERSLEIQLLEYYGLEEQENTIMELQNRLKINNMEAKLFNLNIKSLQADKRKLEEQVADYAKVVSELEAAKAKIKLLRRKLRSEAEQNREHILALKERVAMVQEQEKKALLTDSDDRLKFQNLKDFEEATMELRKSNENLMEENSALAKKLEYLQAIATSVLDDDEETKALREETNRLRLQNKDMAREIEQLHAARCTDIEELVYLRWINACLRYELRNYQAGPGKTTARDLSKSLSPKSEEKAKQLILEYAHKEGTGEKGIDVEDFDPDWWSSSQASYRTESGENDDSSSIDVSSTNQTRSLTKREKILFKLMILLRGKGGSHLKRSSSLELARPSQDIVEMSSSNSPGGITGVSPGIVSGTDGFNMRSRTSSQSSTKLSLDLPRSPYFQGSTEGSMNLDGAGAKSDEGSSFIYKVINPISEDVSGLTTENQHRQDSRDAQISKLEKYADALKGSRRKSSCHRRAASVSSF